MRVASETRTKLRLLQLRGCESICVGTAPGLNHKPRTGCKTPHDPPMRVATAGGTRRLVAPGLDMCTCGCSVWWLGYPPPFRRRSKEPFMAAPQPPRTRYRSIVADSARWDGFVLRPGDIVIS